MKFNLKEFKYQFTRDQDSNKEIHKKIVDGANMYGSNFIVLICAIFIASLGLNMNSMEVIIGAMLISPLMGPIIAIGYGIGTYDLVLLKKSTKSLIISIIISILTSTMYFNIAPITKDTSEILSRSNPTMWHVVISFIGGIAGIIGVTRNKANDVITGVTVATALMPPLCTAGYGISTLNVKIFLGSVYVFFINGLFISIATLIITKILKLKSKKA